MKLRLMLTIFTLALAVLLTACSEDPVTVDPVDTTTTTAAVTESTTAPSQDTETPTDTTASTEPTTTTTAPADVEEPQPSDDDDRDGTSVSIETQMRILSDYCREQRFTVYDHYCDDGFTGTNFNRPSF